MKLFEAAGRAYDPQRNMLPLSTQGAPDVLGEAAAARLRDRLSGVCRRLRVTVGASPALDQCSDPNSNFFTPILGLLPGILSPSSGLGRRRRRLDQAGAVQAPAAHSGAAGQAGRPTCGPGPGAQGAVGHAAVAAAAATAPAGRSQIVRRSVRPDAARARRGVQVIRRASRAAAAVVLPVLLAAGLLTGCSSGAKTISATVTFDDVADMANGALVELADVPIGKVASIKLAATGPVSAWRSGPTPRCHRT